MLANAGGVIVSYFEWLMGQQRYEWEADELRLRLRRQLRAAVAQVVAAAERCAAATCARPRSRSPSSRSSRAGLSRGLYP